jgi:hypothetical protein
MKRRLNMSGANVIGEVLRRASLSGVGEIRLPGDLRRALVSNIEKMRENALDVFAKETSKVLSKIDIMHIIDDVLQNYTLKVEAKIDLVPKNEAVRRATKKRAEKAQVKAQLKAKKK